MCVCVCVPNLLEKVQTDGETSGQRAESRGCGLINSGRSQRRQEEGGVIISIQLTLRGCVVTGGLVLPGNSLLP